LHCVFSPFAGNGGSHSQQRREGKKKVGQICPFPVIVSRIHAPPVAEARGETRRYCSADPERIPELFSWFFGLFCNF